MTAADAQEFAFRSKLPWPVWALYRFVRVPAVASAFMGFWSIAVLLAWVVLPLLALDALFNRNNRFARVARCQRLLSWSFRGFHAYMRALRLVDARVAPLPAREAGARGRVLVANHTTLVDMTAMLAAYPRVCCVAKDSMARSPFIGPLLRLCGFIGAGREIMDRGAAIEEARAWLEAGFDVLVFPEGTRSPPGSMHPFQRGAFEIAKRANATVVPIVLRCEPSALTKGRPFWRHPDECAVLTVSPQLPIVPESWKNSRTLRGDVENMYREWLGLKPFLE